MAGFKRQRFIPLLLMICMLFSTAAGNAAAANPAKTNGSYEEIAGHWASEELLQAIDNGVIQGDGSGSILPDRTITRGEFMAIVNRSFGFTEEASIDFKDLQAGDLAYTEAARAVKAAYIRGYEDLTIGIDKQVSREEAAVMLNRIVQLAAPSGGGGARSFKDAGEIASWSMDGVDAIVAANVMSGYEDRSFRPKNPISLAEAVVIANRAKAARGQDVYDKPGTYGPAAGMQSVGKNVVVAVPGVTLQNMHINGDLLLGEGIGEGDVTLNNVTVKGKTIIEGGGANSVHAVDSILLTVVVNNKNNTVRIHASGTSMLSSVTLLTPAILEGSGFAEVVIGEELPDGSIVKLLGSFQTVSVYAGGVTVDFMKGAIKQLRVYESALGVIANIGEGAVITRLELEAAIKTTGAGSILFAILGTKAKQSSFVKPPAKLEQSGTVQLPVSTASPASESTSSTPTPTVTPTTTPTPTSTPTSTPTATPTPEPTTYAVVNEGTGQAVIVHAANADLRVIQAAAKIAGYVEQSTGARLPIMDEFAWMSSNISDKLPIYVGITAQLSASSRSALPSMDDEGFIIEAGNGGMAIAGKTSAGTEHGVYEFIERYVGVRWLLPGPDGADVPQKSSILVPGGTVKQEPAFMSRILSPMTMPTNQTGPVQFEWARENRLPWRFNAYHNMYLMFPGAKYGTSNPEFYPIINGQRFIPSAQDISGWQPCFSEPATVTEAVKTIVKFFTDNPDQVSYSLGVNDSGGFCEENPNHPMYTGKVNSKGFHDMSDIYYNWVNQVAEEVLEVFPNKWFGVLAYENVIDPPSFALNPRVVPVLTKDRMAWLDPQVEAADDQLMEQWSEVATSTGWYDYIYGTPYAVPRIYPHLMADNYAKAKQMGVSVQYAEIYPNWGEGPKAWLSAKLQWNPDQDVDTLLQEWYERAVGPEAAPDLAAYYAHWEEFWTQRIPNSAWFQKYKNSIYLMFSDPIYLDLVTMEDMTVSRQLLESALAKAVTDKQKARASLLLRAFEYYEASAVSYMYSKANSGSGGDINLAIEQLFSDEDAGSEWTEKRIQLLESFKNDPVLLHPLDPRIFGLTWSGTPNLAGQFWNIVDYVKRHEPSGGPISDRLHGYTESADPRTKQIAQTLEKVLAGPPSLTVNGSFETATNQLPNGWAEWLTVAKQSTVTEHVYSGQAGVGIQLAGGGSMGGVLQNLTTKPGPLAGRLFFKVPENTVTANGTLQLIFHYRLKNETTVFFALRSESKRLADYAGEGWEAIDLFGEIPETVNGFEIDYAQLVVLVEGLPAESTIYVDDVEIYQY
ncbi:DUF4838 domain-containing protein [Paenibacillus contaminans]|nr:DUF4838 domain-containing protein [Paenibacillus contaminans]